MSANWYGPAKPGQAISTGKSNMKKGQDKKPLKRINLLINAILRTPFEGVGKPEPLKQNLRGYWSRRIDTTNRVVYAVDDNAITIVSCRYHY